jgi:hypothetical protein
MNDLPPTHASADGELADRSHVNDLIPLDAERDPNVKNDHQYSRVVPFLQLTTHPLSLVTTAVSALLSKLSKNEPQVPVPSLMETGAP